MNLRYINLMLFVLFLNCQKEEGLVLEFINEEVNAYCPDNKCGNIEDSFDIDFFEKANNKIKFKLTNYDKVTYVFIPLCDEFWDTGCSLEDAFPESFMSINYNNFIIKDDLGSEIDYNTILEEYSDSELDVYKKTKDSLSNIFYSKTGYLKKSIKWKKINSEITRNIIIIHPNESLFFETYVSFPINRNIASSLLEKIPLKTNKTYTVKLKMINNLKSIEEWLTDAQVETFKLNDYKFYNKKIESNSIPIIFKK